MILKNSSELHLYDLHKFEFFFFYFLVYIRDSIYSMWMVNLNRLWYIWVVVVVVVVMKFMKVSIFQPFKQQLNFVGIYFKRSSFYSYLSPFSSSYDHRDAYTFHLFVAVHHCDDFLNDDPHLKTPFSHHRPLLYFDYVPPLRLHHDFSSTVPHTLTKEI